MNTIETKFLTEGMRFSSPLLFDDKKNMFLPEHKPLRKLHLDTIQRWKILYLVTQGKLLASDDDGAELAAKTNPILRDYLTAIKSMEVVFLAYKEGQCIDKALINKASKIIYQLVTSGRNAVSGLILTETQNHLSFAVSAVNVAILSLIIGIDLSFSQRNLLHLLTTALLHDLDMIAVPEQIINKKGHLTVEEFEILKAHPLKTARTVTDVLMYPKEIAVILLQHHERWDGDGYPEGRGGQDIDISARVLSVADAFEAMISEKPYHNSMTAYDALKNLLADKEKRFDPAILKVFIKSIGVYPVGSYVVLNDSSIAKVTEGDPNAPFMPTIKIIISKGVAGKVDAVINLKKQKTVFITRAINPKELGISA